VSLRGPRQAGSSHRRAGGRRLRALGATLGRLPTPAWLCAAVACLNAVCWSLITPPFQVPDEPEHVAYVKNLAEAGRLPTRTGSFSLEEAIALEDLHLQSVAEQPENHTISTQAQQERLQRDLADSQRPPERGSEYAGVAASQPPLYYALQAIPYTLGAGGTLLDRIELMRLLSALMGGATALFTFLFVREALPRSAWAWTVGGLCAALVPLLGFMSGSVNPDALLYAVSAALFYVLARAFRRGLTRAHAVALGSLIACGLLTKLNFIGILPGALLGTIVLGARAARAQRPGACANTLLALAIALSPAIVYVGAHVVSGDPALGIVSTAIDSTRGSLASELSYIWQLYLPRLPGMRDDFPGIFTTRQVWFDWYVGLYGWLDTTFPGWVYDLALIPALLITGLCVRSLIAGIPALRARTAELAVYSAMCLGLMLVIGADSYRSFPGIDAEYAQVRYLLPLLPLLGAALTLAARGAGRRWGPVLGAGLIVLFLAHDIFSQLQVVARFYG
jgi:4-amino-4-deoxy-L-arabinose transferase-like glycosyltransferase